MAYTRLSARWNESCFMPGDDANRCHQSDAIGMEQADIISPIALLNKINIGYSNLTAWIACLNSEISIAAWSPLHDRRSVNISVCLMVDNVTICFLIAESSIVSSRSRAPYLFVIFSYLPVINSQLLCTNLADLIGWRIWIANSSPPQIKWIAKYLRSKHVRCKYNITVSKWGHQCPMLSVRIDVLHAPLSIHRHTQTHRIAMGVICALMQYNTNSWWLLCIIVSIVIITNEKNVTNLNWLCSIPLKIPNYSGIHDFSYAYQSWKVILEQTAGIRIKYSSHTVHHTICCLLVIRSLMLILHYFTRMQLIRRSADSSTSNGDTMKMPEITNEEWERDRETQKYRISLEKRWQTKIRCLISNWIQ